MSTLVNVQMYGAFGTEVSDAIMIAPPEMGSGMIEALIDNLKWRYSNDQDSDRAIAYLEQAGFKKANMMELIVGGDL